MSLLSALQWWQWLALALVPPAIIALYFLKLRRQPVQVPSTYLWARTLEDLHVNSLWQRLRQSLLLLLQLLLLLLLIISLLRPGWRGTQLSGNRFIFLLDTSASMSATDVTPSRLEKARERALDLIAQMRTGEAAMVISFSDVARIEQSFTDNRSALRQAVRQITPTQRSSDLSEALRAASGLANPGRTSEVGTTDIQVAEAMPATVYILSDGGFRDLPDFSLGNLEPVYVPIGGEAPHNVGVVAFSADRNVEKPGYTQAFGRLQNAGPDPVTVEASLFVDDRLLDAAQVTVPNEQSAAVQFEFPEAEEARLRLAVSHADPLAIDNQAFATVNPPRQAKVLVISPGNDALRLACRTDEALKIAEVSFATPEVLATREHQNQVAAGAFDLLIYDQCAPERMPQGNTMFLGKLPPAGGWTAGAAEGPLLITDTNRQHPLMQLVEMGDVRFVEGFSIKPPPGGLPLMDVVSGPLLVIAPRQGFEDLVLGAEIVHVTDKGQTEVNTDWPIRRSFPVFFLNVLRYLGGDRSVGAAPSVRPGTPVTIRTHASVPRIEVTSPSGRKTRLERESGGSFLFSDTAELGIYEIREGSRPEVTQRIAVNLFDARESDLRLREIVDLGHEQVRGRRQMQAARTELWKWLLVLGICVLLFEWYVYNRRVYL